MFRRQRHLARRGQRVLPNRLAYLKKTFHEDTITRVILILNGIPPNELRWFPAVGPIREEARKEGGYTTAGTLRSARDRAFALPVPQTHPSEPYLTWLASQLQRALKTYVRAQKKLTKAGCPSFETMGAYAEAEREFARVSRQAGTHFAHIVDWAAATNADLGRFTLEQAAREAQVWHTRLRLRVTVAEVRPGEAVWRFKDGWTVQRLSPDMLRAEGQALDHCVGGGGYDRRAARGLLVSLRDPDNKPHVTIELAHAAPGDAKPYTVEQVKGRSDRTPRTMEEELREKLTNFLDAISDREAWTGDAAQLLVDRVESEWLDTLLAGDLTGAADEAREAGEDEVAHTIGVLHNLLVNEQPHNAEADWDIDEGVLTLSLTSEIGNVEEASRELAADPEFTEAFAAGWAELTPEERRRIIQGSFVLADFEDIDPDPDDPEELLEPIERAVADHILVGTFRVATYSVKSSRARYGRAYSRVHPALQLDPHEKLYLDKTDEFFADGTDEIKEETTWTLPSNPEEWQDPYMEDALYVDHVDLSHTYRLWAWALESWLASELRWEGHAIREAFEDILAFVPTRVDSARARYEQLEARGQLRLPFRDRQGRRAYVRRPGRIRIPRRKQRVKRRRQRRR